MTKHEFHTERTKPFFGERKLVQPVARFAKSTSIPVLSRRGDNAL